jgi:hypothetical protein
LTQINDRDTVFCRSKGVDLPKGSMVKVIEPPPDLPLLGRLLAEFAVLADKRAARYSKAYLSSSTPTTGSITSRSTCAFRSHRSGRRQPMPIRIGLPKARTVIDQRPLAMPVPANAFPGGRDVVELCDVVWGRARAGLTPNLQAQSARRKDRHGHDYRRL